MARGRRRAALFARWNLGVVRLLRGVEAIHQGLWLGLLDGDALNAVTTGWYADPRRRPDPAYGRSGLSPWEAAAVEEAFRARREARRLLVVPSRRSALDSLVLHATTLRIPVIEVEGGSLTALAGFDGHQGVALVVAPRRWATIEDVIARALELGERPFVLALDSLEDPHNLGSLLRSAEAAGIHGVLFPTRRAAPLTPSAIKASAGAVEHLLLVPVSDLPGALADLHVRGLKLRLRRIAWGVLEPAELQPRLLIQRIASSVELAADPASVRPERSILLRVVPV